ncbi:FG-GAP-like repeat-containing protein [Winogradskyella ouciana]|uniref:T9SS type A sorting domain-containing protein n=1 Tax=Winogradskyella ouciana TaxID=2608631 RepID=A0A7K1G7S8_9FLAO|nr:FG-GAP-like repeat-containing protein [Winogradskyella ouciana]MTE25347.1 T9SS type A sorting domain-containing protein [Winogradskyella ouciana]
MHFRITFSLILFFVLSDAIAQISFENQATEIGINVTCGNTLYGSGITFYDYDNDGWDDITIASAEGDPIRFLKNINGNFVEQTLNIDSNNWKNKQVNWVDIDNDGDNDLFVTSDNSSNKLYENLGNMIMEDITLSSGMLTDVLVTYGASWGDYNKDGFLDVFLSNRSTSIPNVLYKNNGDNTFSLVNTEAGIINIGTLSFCSAFFDYNNDGHQDIYVANDKIENANTLYNNNGDGTFTDFSVESGSDITIDAMSVTIDDYNADGWMDIYITNDVPGNVFLKNNGDGTFTDVAQPTGTTFNSVGWGAVFLDADNDTDLDLYVSAEHNGSVPGYLSSALYENYNDGSFNIINSSIPNDFAISYSNAIGDTDNDGYPEIVVNNINHDNVFLWKNNSPSTNNWLKVKLEGTESNRNGIGSLIEISINGVKQYRYTLCGEGYLSQNSSSEFFGLGNATVVDYVKVKWLSGVEDIIYNVGANEQIYIIEGSALSINDNELSSMKIYPNPVKDRFMINSEADIDKVLLFNVLGEEVLRVYSTELYENIDITHLQAGTYFAKVTSSNHSKTIKVIKY